MTVFTSHIFTPRIAIPATIPPAPYATCRQTAFAVDGYAELVKVTVQLPVAASIVADSHFFQNEWQLQSTMWSPPNSTS